jgi:hypothetical protein
MSEDAKDAFAVELETITLPPPKRVVATSHLPLGLGDVVSPISVSQSECELVEGALTCCGLAP